MDMYGPEEHVVYTGSGTGRRLGRPLGVWEHGPHGGGTVQAHLKDPAGLAPNHCRTVRVTMKSRGSGPRPPQDSESRNEETSVFLLAEGLAFSL